MTSLFLPPNLPIQMFIFVRTRLLPSILPDNNALLIDRPQTISILVMGVLFGWGIGAAAMRAALAARDQVLLKSTLQKVQSRYVYCVHHDLYMFISFCFKCSRPSEPGNSVQLGDLSRCISRYQVLSTISNILS